MPKWLKTWILSLASCEEATDWISRTEEGRLSPVRWIKLRLHFAICIYCKWFYRQNKIIAAAARHAHKHVSAELTAEEKGAMEETLKGL